MNSALFFFRVLLPFIWLLCGLTIAYLALISRPFMLSFFTDISYYLILTSVLLWVWVLSELITNHRQAIGKVLKSNLSGLIFCVVLASLMFIARPPSVRILADEANIISVSKSLAFEKKADNVTEGLYHFLNFNPISRVIDKRPLLFPFFTSVLHSFTGYRTENAFALNWILLSCLFMIAFLGMKYALGHTTWGWVTVLMVAAQPLVWQTATAGGLEIIQVVFFALSMAALLYFLRFPSAQSLLLLWLQLLLFLNTRYESLGSTIITVTALFWLKKISQEQILKYFWIYTLTPLLLLPAFCQRLLQFNDRELPQSSVLAAFSYKYFLSNNVLFAKNLFRSDFRLPYATLINLIGLIFLVYLIILLVRRRIATQTADRQWTWLVLGNIAFLWITFTSYHQGRMDHPSMSRFYLIFACLTSLLFVFGLSRLPWLVLRQKTLLSLMLALSMFLVYAPVGIENRFSNAQEVVREYDFFLNFLKSQPNRNFMIICPWPNFYTIHDMGSISLTHANSDLKNVRLQFSRFLYEKIFVLQRISYDSNQPIPEDTLNPTYQLETLHRLQNRPDRYLRISLVRNILPDAAGAAAAVPKSAKPVKTP